MKKIKFTCSNCQAKLRVPTHLAGISAPCPKCGRKITAPTDLDSIVDDDPVPTPRQRPARPETQMTPKAAPTASGTRTAVADAPPRTEAPAGVPREPEISRPAPIPASSGHANAAMEPREMSDAPPVPVQEAPAAPAPPMEPELPVEEEPIVEETLLTPPVAPAPVVTETAVPLEDTQPIQVNPLPGTLPELKSGVPGSDETLPRLDADRLADDTGALNPSPLTPTGPTKLHLPRESDLNGQQSPGDFIVPSSSISTVPVVDPNPDAEENRFIPPPTPVIPDLSDLDMTSPGVPMEELGDFPDQPAEAPVVAETPEFSPPHHPEVPVSPVQPTSLQPPVADETTGAAPLEDPYPSADSVYPEEPVHPVEPTPAAEVPADATGDHPGTDSAGMIQLGQEEEETTLPAGLSSGSMERLLSEQAAPDHTAPIAPAPGPEAAAPHDELEAMFEAPAAARDRSGHESQSLEEMFGEIPADGGGKKLTKVVMFSMIGAVVIISIVVVIIAGNAAGGFSTPQITSNQTEITPPPRISEIPPENSQAPSDSDTPPITDAPAVIDPVAQERVEENAEGITRSTTTLPGDTSEPVVIADSPPAVIDPPATSESVTAGDAPALSFDERVQQIVNGSGESGAQMNIIGGGSEVSPLDSLDDTIASLESGAADMVNEASGIANDVTDDAVAALTGGAAATAASNYNPPAAFPAPGPNDAPLGRTHDLLDAFLRAPDWQSRIPYTYQGESLRPVIEDYYKKWPVTSFERFSLSLFQMEQDTALGGPYWVYLVSTNDLDQGYPVIIRVEDGNLKVDWEIYSEFQDQHFVEFQQGAIASPHTFRLVIERVSDYFGSDRDSFTNLDDYLVYQINPPYGDLSEYSEYAFVRKDSELAGELDAVVGLNDEPLAVIITLEQKAFAHGMKHLEITDYVTEGWFR